MYAAVEGDEIYYWGRLLYGLDYGLDSFLYVIHDPWPTFSVLCLPFSLECYNGR